MRLEPGDPAPVFGGEDLAGNPIDLDGLGSRRVLLTFYRFVSCPFCNLRVAEVRRRMDELRAADIQPVGVFHSSRERILRHLADDQPPFPVVPDPDMTLYRTWRVERSALGVLRGMMRVGALVRAAAAGHPPIPDDRRVTGLPADFLVGPDGRLELAHYGRDIGDHAELDLVLRSAVRAAR